MSTNSTSRFTSLLFVLGLFGLVLAVLMQTAHAQGLPAEEPVTEPDDGGIGGDERTDVNKDGPDQTDDSGTNTDGDMGLGVVGAGEGSQSGSSDQQQNTAGDSGGDSGGRAASLISASRPAARPGPPAPCYEWTTEDLGIAEDGLPITSTYCSIRYACGAERVDDIVSGSIEGETPGNYADYVVAFAGKLDAANAPIIAIESNPVLSPGESSPEIPLASGEAGLATLTRSLAENGLGDAPGELFLPLFRFCRRGAGGDIEMDPTAEPELLPSFSWISLGDEFDIPGASTNIYRLVEERLRARRPTLQSIPPIADGIGIVKFPMWFWLEGHDEIVEETAVSQPTGTARVTGRATFKHVTWKLGDIELTCEPEDMKAYVPGMDLRSRSERPKCHHIFTDLAKFRADITLTYDMEQQEATRRSPNHPYVATAWEPHPNGPTISVTIAGPQLSIEEIYAVNIPIDS